MRLSVSSVLCDCCLALYALIILETLVSKVMKIHLLLLSKNQKLGMLLFRLLRKSGCEGVIFTSIWVCSEGVRTQNQNLGLGPIL